MEANRNMPSLIFPCNERTCVDGRQNVRGFPKLQIFWWQVAAERPPYLSEFPTFCDDEKVLPPNPQISLQQVTRRTLFNSLLNGKQELLFLGPCFVPLFCDSSKTIKSRVLIVYLLL